MSYFTSIYVKLYKIINNYFEKKDILCIINYFNFIFCKFKTIKFNFIKLNRNIPDEYSRFHVCFPTSMKQESVSCIQFQFLSYKN